MVGLHPAGNAPRPIWADQLPEPYQNAFTALPFEEVAGWVTDPLSNAGISDYSLWWIDVPEYLRTTYELYTRLGGSETVDAPEYQKIEPELTKVVQQYRVSDGLVLRHRRLLWLAYMPE